MAPHPTPGRLTGLWVVLRTLQKLGDGVKSQDLVSFASRTSLRSGGLPIRDSYGLGLKGGFVQERNGMVFLGTLGAEALHRCKEDEPDGSVRRLFLSVLLLRDPPTWVAYWQGDPGSLEFLLTDSDRSMLSSAGLYPVAPSPDLMADEWWQALAIVPVPEDTQARRKQIGDAGEQLSFEFERTRLREEGFPELAEKVWWAAKESPAYGFDIASFAGKSFKGNRPSAPLAIETKSVAFPVGSVFPLHLTLHEWETSKRHGARYVLHLWESVRPESSTTKRASLPRIVNGAALADHLPAPPPCGGRCKWESTYIELPIATPKLP